MNLNTEPAALVGAIEAILALLLAFGLDLTVEQVGAIMAAVTTVLALFVRSRVTPTVKVNTVDPEYRS